MNCFFSKRYSLFLRMAALFLAAALSVTVFTGCTEVRISTPMDEDVMLMVDKQSCGTDEAMMRLLEVRDQYVKLGNEYLWQTQISNESMADYIKSTVKDELTKYTASFVMADNLAVYLTDEEKSQAALDGEAAYKKLSEKYDLSKYGITSETAANLYEKKAVYQMVYNKVSENLTMDISEADTKVIEVNYVYMDASFGYDAADALRLSIKNGEDFEYACTEAGLEPEMRRVIMRGERDSRFENVAYALVDGELSEVVEIGKEGYYIIQCIEDYMVSESVSNKNKIISEARKQAFEQAYSDFAKKAKLRFNTDEWNKIDVESL